MNARKSKFFLALAAMLIAATPEAQPPPGAEALPGLLDFKFDFQKDNDWDPDKGPACVKDLDSHSRLDFTPSPTYRHWSSFFENAAKRPEEIEGEWRLVGSAAFGYGPSRDDDCRIEGKSCAKGNCSIVITPCRYCLYSEVASNPEGMQSATSSYDADDTSVMRMKIDKNRVSVSGWCLGDCRAMNLAAPRSDYRRTYDLKDNPDSIGWLAAHDVWNDRDGQTAWACRQFTDGSSRLICRARVKGHEEKFQSFMVYARHEARDAIETLGPVLKNFLPMPAPEGIKWENRPKD